MGDHCNGKKNASNVLYRNYTISSRRLVWYPYQWINHSILLSCKRKPTLTDMSGEWKVIFKASASKNQDKIKTWNDIFEIPLQFTEHIRTFHKRFIEDFAHKNKLKGQRLTKAKLVVELKDYRENAIGDVRLETMAQLKFIWASYHIKTNDKSQLALLTHTIEFLTKRTKP